MSNTKILRHLMRLHNMDEKELARKSGICESTIRGIMGDEKRGMKYKTAERLGKVFNVFPDTFDVRSRSGPQQVYHNQTTSKSLCWFCKNAVPDVKRGCSWSRSLEPVSGWDAIPSKHLAGSYRVRSCPEFVSDNEDPAQQGRKTRQIQSGGVQPMTNLSLYGTER